MTVLLTRMDCNWGWTDLFCGAGGVSEGLVRAGHNVDAAYNHWQTAVNTHQSNHPNTRHECVDINHYDMRRLPHSRFLWASVICTEASPAGGNKKRRGQLSLVLDEHGDQVPDEAFERTRACALDVIRATEVHRYDMIVVENVVEFHTTWELFDWWRQGMAILGYQSKVFSMSAAHVGGFGNDPAAQWRDRILIAFVRNGLPMIDLTPAPTAWCPECGVDVVAVQTWRNRRTVGKYRQQYDYRCPNSSCRNTVVEPYVVPAETVIDWADLGTIIGDRPLKEFFKGRGAARRSLGFHRLAPDTLTKIGRALSEYSDWYEPLLVTTTHGGDDPRALPARLAPLPTRTAKIGDGFVTPPGAVIIEQRGGGSLYRPVTHPLATLGTSRNHGLVIPYRKGSGRPTSEPLLTLATRDSAGIVRPTYEVEDCHYRMLRPREALLAQRFPRDYIVHGNQGEQTMQAGNAVPVNLSQFVGERTTQTFGRAA